MHGFLKSYGEVWYDYDYSEGGNFQTYGGKHCTILRRVESFRYGYNVMANFSQYYKFDYYSMSTYDV